MSDDWDLNAIVRGARSSSPPINNVPNVTPATDYPYDIPTNENSFVDHGLSHDHGDLFSGLQEIYEQFYGNMVPPTFNNISRTTSVMSQTTQPARFESIFDQLPFSQIGNSMQQVQDGAVLNNNVQLQGGHSVQTFVVSSSPGNPARRRRRRNTFEKVIVHMTADEVAADSVSWRKYGQKPIKGSPHPRHYYRCSIGKGCGAKKQVERNFINPANFVVSYYGEHSHPRITRRGSCAGNNNNNNTVNHPLRVGFPSSSGSGSSSTQSPPTMLSGANEQNHDPEMMMLHIDDEYENLMMISDLMDDDTEIFTELNDPGQSSGATMSPPWTPIPSDAFDDEDGDWGISKPKDDGTPSTKST